MEAFSGRGFPLSQHLIIGAKIFALYGLLYLSAQHFPIRTPIELPHSYLDDYISLNSSWVWIYMIAYPYVPISFLMLKSKYLIQSYAKSYVALTVSTFIIFVAFPTILPREQYPVDSSFSGQALDFLRSTDAPTNCLPSLHVATSFLSSWWLLLQNKYLGIIGFIFTVLVMWSTLALKQHIIWDVITGTIAAMIAVFVPIYFSRDI